MSKKRFPSGWVRRLRFPWRARLSLLLAGGRWSARVSVSLRRALRQLVFSGILANVSDAIVNTYQSIYLLTLGASYAQIGLLGSFSNLAMPLAMLPGGRLAARRSRYKRLVVLPSLLGRLMLLGMVLLPLLGSDVRWLIYLGIGFAVTRAFLLHLVTPAWTAMLGDIVPARWRGRYFSARNLFMGAAAFAALLLVGQLVDLFEAVQGYQLVLGIAVVAALGSSYFLSRVSEPEQKAAAQNVSERVSLWRRLRQQGPFLRFTAVATLWNTAVSVGGPFFIVYLVDQTGASGSMVALTSAVSTLAALPAQRIFGVLTDRRGSIWVNRLTGLVIPLVPALWGFIQQPWQAFPIQIVSGFAWAGYNLSAFNLLLDLTPEGERTSFVAFHQSLVGVGMSLGAGLGGWLAQTYGYRPVFLTSAAGRLSAAVLFILTTVPAGVWRRWGAALQHRCRGTVLSVRRRLRKIKRGVHVTFEGVKHWLSKVSRWAKEQLDG
jgi:MFS family permease